MSLWCSESEEHLSYLGPSETFWLRYSEQNTWMNSCSPFDGDRAKYTISIQSACLCETSTDSIFPSLVCSERGQVHLPPINGGSQRGSTLTQPPLTQPM